jgi:polysaccharide biosynthesis protein PslH
VAGVVFATHRPPWPLDNGQRIRAARLAQGLAAQLELTLVTFADGPVYDETRASRADLERLLPGARIELVPYDRRHPGGARRRILRPSSAMWGPYATGALRAALQRLVNADPTAVLHLDSPGVALAARGLAPGRTAFAPHNVEHRIVREVIPARPATHRPFLEVEWRKIAREERRCWRAADVCLAVSELDAATLRAGGARRVELCPNGAEPHDALAVRPPAGPGEVRLLFVGSGAYWPYEHGLAWFAREVMPRLRDQGPVRFDVVGERPLEPVTGAGISYHGRVPDVIPFYAAADALVVPVFEGSGTRLKVVEAALLGRPVISTALGAEGLPIRPGEHYTGAKTPDQWVAAVARLRAGDLRRTAAAARAALEAFTWPRIASGLADLYRQMTSTR